mgnify:CR=1 FL=1
MVFDTAIVGTGPAAISAALTLKLHKKNIVWFGSRKLSPKVEKSEMIANYPGAAMVTGPELNRLYQEQIARAGLEITERQVTNILANRRGFMLQAGDEIFDAKTVLLATGSVSPTGFPGEAELLGHGVSYCATCDGFLYPGKAIAVYCGSREFEHEVIYLAEIAAKVYLFTPYSACEIIRKAEIHLRTGSRDRSYPDRRYYPEFGRGFRPAQRRCPGHPAARSGIGRRQYRC